MHGFQLVYLLVLCASAGAPTYALLRGGDVFSGDLSFDGGPRAARASSTRTPAQQS